MAADETPRSEPTDTSAQPSPHIRLRVDLVVEVADAAVLTRAALEHVDRDELMPDEERAHAREVIGADAGEALACLVDPFDLVRDVPGVELAHASWGSEEMDAGDLDAFSFLEGAEGVEESLEQEETAGQTGGGRPDAAAEQDARAPGEDGDEQPAPSTADEEPAGEAREAGGAREDVHSLESVRP